MNKRFASASWRAEAVPTNRPKLLVVLRWLPSVVAAYLFGTGGVWRGTDVVVAATGTGREVLRLVGKDVGEAEDALRVIRADLDRLSEEEFLREWGVV